MDPHFSICIPTYKRPELLDFCLERLQALERFGKPFEVVVSDNSPSPEESSRVVEGRRGSMPYVRYVHQPKHVPTCVGQINALRNATAPILVYLADDDSLIPESLMAYIERMEREPDLAAIFADWMAYDDEQDKELHRYFDLLKEPVAFGPDNPLGLVNFALSHQIYPENTIYRREALWRSDCMSKRGSNWHHLWMYLLSRVGRVAFEVTPFYRENRILKKRFQRGYWANMLGSLEIIGDEMRNMLETILFWALRDSGAASVPPDQMLVAKQLIEQFLHRRTRLEIDRAAQARNWLLATDLCRRMALWYGPATPELQQQDVVRIAYPAALQTIQEMHDALTEVSGVLLVGFRSHAVYDALRQQYPELKVFEPDQTLPTDIPGAPLIVYKHDPGLVHPSLPGARPGYCLHFDRIFQRCNCAALRIDLDPL